MTKVGAPIFVWRGDTLSYQNAVYMGDISARTKLWFAVKADHVDADAAAQIFVEETAGLLYLGGAAAAVPGNGSIAVLDAALGLISVSVAASEMAKLARGAWYYEVQVLSPAGVTTSLRGRFTLVADVTRATA